MAKLIDRVRTLVLKSPKLVRIAKDVYRNPVVSHTPPYKWFTRRQAAAAEAKIAQARPRVSIETILTCNAVCTMCVHSEKKMVGVMDRELFRRLIGELADWGLDEVALSIYGEPLIDKHWRERLQIVRDAGLSFSFFSNASMLTEELAAHMLDIGGWNAVNFSVNGFSKEAYEKVMPPLKRDRVYGNIQRFLELRRQRGMQTPSVTVSCVTLAENHHEIDEYTRFWRAAGVDRVSIADRTDWLGELKKDDKALPIGRRLRVLQADAWLPPCASLWKELYVYADGGVAPCCEDAARRELIVGNVNDTPLREIFLGQTHQRLRDEHLADRRTEHPQCGPCRVNWPWV